MRPIVLVVGTGVLCAVLGGCHSSEIDDDAESESEQEPEPEALELSVEGISVSDGELRLDATFVEGSADVSIWAASDSCERKEIGHGIATRTGFTWRLDGADLAEAIRCNLLVRVRLVDEGVRHRKEQELPVILLDVDGELRKEQADPSSEETSSSGEYVSPAEDVVRDILRRRPMGLAREPLHAIIQIGVRSVELFPSPPLEGSEEPWSEGDTAPSGSPMLPGLP